MKKKSNSQPPRRSFSEGGFFNLRLLIASLFCLVGIFMVLIAGVIYSDSANAQATTPAQPSSGLPTLMRMVGPARLDQDLRSLPYIPPSAEVEERRLTRHPHPETGGPPPISGFARFQSLLEQVLAPVPAMPGPVLTFDGMNAAQSGCNCSPPDSDGDVGPNHYVNVVNSSIKIFDKSGNPLNGANGTTFNSFFSGLGNSTPCGNNENKGDPFVFYDHLADRWVVSDFAFSNFPGPGPFYECIGVSQSPDPVAGPWALYAIQTDTDPANVTQLGDYPKLAMWNSGGVVPQNAYFLTVNLFTDNTSTGFKGVRAFALDRASMLSGGPANAIAFTISPASLGDSYSLVPAGFRAGDPPPAGRNEMLLAIDSPATGGVNLTQVKGWRFHVDFGTPTNSTLGVGVNHSPNALITVNEFVDAFTTATTLLVPQQGTSQRLDTLGDRIMTPVVYQSRNATESLWASHTVCTDLNCTGPTAVRWYQFNVTGGNFPAMPVQQQSWTNGNDGLWRWMPSIAADQNGNVAIGYSTSSPAQFPSIRYAGRLAIDALNNLAQGEAIMTVGGGAQTMSSRWGDYSMTTIDPADNKTFWHVNEYYPATADKSWFTRIGRFNFPTGAVPPNLPNTDFNHDAKPDFVLYNGGARQTAIWYMNNNVFLFGAFAPTLPAGWNVIDVADFNGDGNLDYALFNASTRQTAIWYLSGVTFIGGAFGPTLPSGWALVATGDFNANGKPDYVLYNASTRQTAIWYMNNNVFVNGAFGPTLPAGWSLAGVADFNSDGQRDYLLFNASTRQTAIWYLNNNIFLTGAFGPTVPSGWQLIGTADFNGDGKPDYLLYNPSTRQTAIWYLNNNIFLTGAFGPTVPTGWTLFAP